ncbi:MAG: hypothetical protein WBP59_14500 [Ilumatobacteraceae bacterium]
MRSAPSRAAIGAALFTLLFAACSGGSDDSASTARSTPTDTEADDTDAVASSSGSAEASIETTPDTAPASALDGDGSIATVPVDQIPGIDSTDVFCRSWSEFGGTFQALALASNFAADQLTAVGAEVAASGVLLDAVAAMSENFPDDVADERELFLDGLLGPFARRATSAHAELVDAGLTDEQIDEIGAAWLATLADEGLGNPDIVVVVPSDSAEAFDVAVVAFGSRLPRIVEDPTLITDADAVETQTYIAANCPDQGTLGGNDFVGD